MITVYVDQSGKIERSDTVTVVAFANGKTKSIIIGAVEKQKLIRGMRELDFPNKTFIIKIFAALVYLLVKDEKISLLKIDREYPGHEALLRQIIRQLYQKNNKIPPGVEFVLVGKESLAHKVAIGTFKRDLKPNLKTGKVEIINLLYKKIAGAPDLVGKISS